MLIVDDVTFNKNFYYFLWCIQCSEYTIFIKYNKVLIIISITNGTICGVYDNYSLLTIDKKENTKNQHSFKTASTVIDKNRCTNRKYAKKNIAKASMYAKMRFLNNASVLSCESKYCVVVALIIINI